MAALFAFLHHFAAFALVAALAVELVLLRDELTAARARTLRVVDAVYGVSAMLLLAVGLARVFWLEKGAAYYFHSWPFIAKLSLFVVAGLLSIYPTVTFRSWSARLKQGQAPDAKPGTLRALRRVVHWQLAAVVAILLCAALMARGIGFLG